MKESVDKLPDPRVAVFDRTCVFDAIGFEGIGRGAGIEPRVDSVGELTGLGVTVLEGPGSSDAGLDNAVSCTWFEPREDSSTGFAVAMNEGLTRTVRGRAVGVI